MTTLDDTGRAIREVADRAGDFVVGLGQRWGVGSGILLGEGRVLTNAHNVRREQVTVTLSDGTVTTGTLLGSDIDRDVAVVSIEGGPGGVEWVPGDSNLEIGAVVFALSNPGGRGLRVTAGFVSGTQRSFRGPRGRRIAGSIEHTAPLLPGSSGGPIVDGEGRLLGLNTNRLGEGFYLAIPADGSLRQIADSLARGETPARPRLGVGLAPSHVARNLRQAVGLAPEDGLLVRVVEDDSPAASAGIREGDLLVEAGGKKLVDFDVLFDALEGAASRLEVKVIRGTDEHILEVSLN
ncbi:MAG: S1C family serine protease [Actinomycetota bacterium]|nr:S1C family serine protease [Actinomycetota bacterium]